jgi:hypothetical protein
MSGYIAARTRTVLGASVLSACAALAAAGPGDVVKTAYMAANAGQYSELEKYLSSEALNAMTGPLGAKAGGVKGIWDKETRNGAIDKVEVLGEDIRGEGGRVHIRVTFKDGKSKEDRVPMIQEKGEWRMTIATK